MTRVWNTPVFILATIYFLVDEVFSYAICPLTAWLAKEGGCLVSPGEFYGEAGSGHVRVAMVQPGDRLELVGARLSSTADRE